MTTEAIGNKLETLALWFDKFQDAKCIDIMAWSLASYNLSTLEEYLKRDCKIRIFLPSADSEYFAQRCKSININVCRVLEWYEK